MFTDDVFFVTDAAKPANLVPGASSKYGTLAPLTAYLALLSNGQLILTIQHGEAARIMR